MSKKLTEKQRRFADEYIITGTAYSAAKKAGYSEKYAKTDSHKLLENTRIKNYVESRLAEIKSEKVADQQEIMEYLTAVMRGEAKGTALVGLGMGEQSVRQVAPTVAEKTSAAINLGKRYAMWTDKQQVENITPNFVEDVPEDD